MKPDLEHSKIKKEKVVLNYYKSYSKGPGLDNVKPSVKIVKKSKKLVLTGTHLKTRKYVPEPEVPNDNETIIMPKVIGSVPKTVDKVILPAERVSGEPKPAEPIPEKPTQSPAKQEEKPIPEKPTQSPAKQEEKPVPEKPTQSPAKKEEKPAEEIDPALLA